MRRYSLQERASFFAAVCSGSSIQAAAWEFGVSHQCGHLWWQQSAAMTIQLGKNGGLPRTAPQGDDWVGRGLTSRQRDQIAEGLAQGLKQAEIARRIGRDRSVVCRELKRHRGEDGSYYPSVARQRAWVNARRPKAFKLHDEGLCEEIATWMDDGWSPGLIARVLKVDAGGDHTRYVCAETIYRALYVQTRGSLRADLARQLSTRRTQRKTRTATRRGTAIYAEAFKISERPACVADRAVPGHWEADLILGRANGSAIGTLVERATRFVILLHLPDGDHGADAVAAAMIAAMSQLPEHLRRSTAYDRGSEMARYRDIQLALQMPIYFCDPHSPWQRGTNENTNRLLRHWFEKGTDLSVHTPGDLKRVQDKLNARPRPTLGMKTPAQALDEYLQQNAA